MGRLRRKRNHHGIRDIKRKLVTKHRTRDLDQIINDLEPENAEKLNNQPFNLELPGQGQHYCIACAKYFLDKFALDAHTKSKVHRRRLKEVNFGSHSQQDSEAAVGLKTDNGLMNKEMVFTTE